MSVKTAPVTRRRFCSDMVSVLVSAIRCPLLGVGFTMSFTRHRLRGADYTASVTQRRIHGVGFTASTTQRRQHNVGYTAFLARCQLRNVVYTNYTASNIQYTVSDTRRRIHGVGYTASVTWRWLHGVGYTASASRHRFHSVVCVMPDIRLALHGVDGVENPTSATLCRFQGVGFTVASVTRRRLHNTGHMVYVTRYQFNVIPYKLEGIDYPVSLNSSISYPAPLPRRRFNDVVYTVSVTRRRRLRGLG